MAAAYWLAGHAFARIEERWWWIPAAIATHSAILIAAAVTIVRSVQ